MCLLFPRRRKASQNDWLDRIQGVVVVVVVVEGNVPAFMMMKGSWWASIWITDAGEASISRGEPFQLTFGHVHWPNVNSTVRNTVFHFFSLSKKWSNFVPLPRQKKLFAYLQEAPCDPGSNTPGFMCVCVCVSHFEIYENFSKQMIDKSILKNIFPVFSLSRKVI